MISHKTYYRASDIRIFVQEMLIVSPTNGSKRKIKLDKQVEKSIFILSDMISKQFWGAVYGVTWDSKNLYRQMYVAN